MLFQKINSLLDQVDEKAEILEYSGSQSPLISVCLISFNHEKYLAQTLDSVLSQKTNVGFEIIISDDGSKDKSSEIIKGYANKYPELIRGFLHERNLSQTYTPSSAAPGKINFLYALNKCRGKYIVCVECDDYLIDDYKLQKQFDYLESHKEYSACFHNAWMRFENCVNEKDRLINSNDQKAEVGPEDLLREKEVWFMATASVMFRRHYLEILPEWFLNSKSGDIPLYIILSDDRPIAYLKDIMSVYRRHSAGMSYSDSIYDSRFIQNRIFMYSMLSDYNHGKYKSLIRPIIADYSRMMLQTRQAQANYFNRLKFLIQHLFRVRGNTGFRKIEILKFIFPEILINLLINFFRKLGFKIA